MSHDSRCLPGSSGGVWATAWEWTEHYESRVGHLGGDGTASLVDTFSLSTVPGTSGSPMNIAVDPGGTVWVSGSYEDDDTAHNNTVTSSDADTRFDG
jgi:hypothetical protein